MHKQVTALLSAGGSPGKLAAFGGALGAAGLNIAMIGGAEWLHDGPVTFVLDKDSQDERRAFEAICERDEIPWLSFVMVAVTLNNEPGELGRAAAAVGDINIYSVIVLDSEDGHAVVGLGIRPSKADDAVSRLKAASFDAERRPHIPDPGHEPDEGTEWDQRTEDLLPHWEGTDASKHDSRFWQPPNRSA